MTTAGGFVPTAGGRRRSIRTQLRLWMVAVSTLTLVPFTAAGILQERRQALELESAHAATLLEHLGHMPEFKGTAAEATERLSLLGGSLHATGASLALVPRGSREEAPAILVLARRRLSLRDADLELLYRAARSRLDSLTRRAVLIHSVHGLVALAGLLAGTEWILRRKLLAPLHAISHQVSLMRDGRGWAPRLPHIDDELGELSEALRQLGPGLEQQVREWIEAEQRAAVALALAHAKLKLKATSVRARELVTALTGAAAMPAGDHARLLATLAAEVDALPSIAENEAVLALALPAARSAEA